MNSVSKLSTRPKSIPERIKSPATQKEYLASVSSYTDENSNPFTFIDNDAPSRIIPYRPVLKMRQDQRTPLRDITKTISKKANQIANLNAGKKNFISNQLCDFKKICSNGKNNKKEYQSGILKKVKQLSNQTLASSVKFHLVQCSVCKKSSFDPEIFFLESHSCINSSSTLVCDDCGFELSDVHSLRTHIKAVHQDKTVTFIASKGIKTSQISSCSSSCPTKDCFKMSAKVIEDSRKSLQNMNKVQVHQFLLSRLNTQQEFGMDTSHIIQLGVHGYCANALKSLIGLSDYIVRTIFNEHVSGVKQYKHGNSGSVYSSGKRDKAIAFILHFAECHSENLPDRKCLQLPSYLTIKFIYEQYRESVDPSYALQSRDFYLIFEQAFGRVNRLYDWLPRIVFQSPSTHPVCNECDLISHLRKKAKTEAEANYAETRKRMHMLYVRRKYLLFCYRCELPIRYPEGYLSCVIDDMDQAKLESPFPRTNTKETSGLLKLNNHLTGSIVTNGAFSNDKINFVFLNNDQFPQDSNKTITQLQMIFEFTQNELGRLPRKFLLQTDNCRRDLKNQYVLTYLYLLVDMGIFEEVLMSNMPPGHTHNNVDQMFGVFASHLKKVEIPTFESLMDELKKINVNGSQPVVKELVYTCDFVKLIEPYLLPLNGHSAFYQFKIRRENDSTRLYVKEDELDPDWKFPSGIKMLSGLPLNLQVPVSSFRVDTNYGEIFESVSKKYFPTLSYRFSEEEVTSFKKAWEQRIEMLINLSPTQCEPVNISNLKKGSIVTEPHINNISSICNKKSASITATFYPIELADFSIYDLRKDTSIVFYCEVRKSRPWIGLFIEIIEDDNSKVKVEWLKRDKKHYVIDSHSGEKYTSVLDVETIMFSDVLVNTSSDGDRCGPYLLQPEVRKQIMEAYAERDHNLH